jgi:hypothetical protein
MWIASKFGWFSCVCGKAKKGKGPDLSVIMVRARARTHLEQLMQEYPTPFKGVELRESPTADYRFRVVIPHSTFVGLVAMIAQDVDYTNFKSEVAAREGTSLYEQALHRIWAVMHRVQTALHPGPAARQRLEDGVEGSEEPLDEIVDPDDVDALLAPAPGESDDEAGEPAKV